MLEIAIERCAVITVIVTPGDFIHRGRPLLRVEPAGDDQLNACGELFSIGRKRSALQDLRFPIDELVEIAARALSPGVNDPFTAIACIDWLGAALMDLSAMPTPPARLRDEDGQVRLNVPRLDFADYLHAAVGQLIPYAMKDPNAGAHLVRTLDGVGEAVPDPHHKGLVEAERDNVARVLMTTTGTEGGE